MERPTREQRIVLWGGTAWTTAWLYFSGSKHPFLAGGLGVTWILFWELLGYAHTSARKKSHQQGKEIEPDADLAPVSSGAPSPPGWFLVGETKFVIMNLATLGLYQFFWFYQQWCRVQASTGEKMWPLARAFFAHLWSYYLFARVIAAAEVAGVRVRRLTAGLLALSFILLSWSLYFHRGRWLIQFSLVVPLLPVQRIANRSALQRRPDADMNNRLTTLNWVAIVVSCVFWLLVAIASLIPKEAPVPSASGARAAAEAIRWLASSAD